MPLEPIRIDLSAIAGVGLDLDQYCGVWAVDETRFTAQLSMVAAMDLAAHVQAAAGRKIADATVSVEQGVSVIDIRGTLTKRGSSLSDAGSMTRIRQAIRDAASNPDVSSIVLRIDSPGGTTAGTADLAAEVAAAKSKKPVYAYVEDLAASAAYWVASQATKVYANAQTALVGSIGTYMAVYDYSRAAANAGVEAVVIRSTPLKGAGFEGDKITDAQKAAWQEMVDGLQMQFNAAVMQGRGMSSEAVAAVATGRVFNASEALRLGLIDGVKSFDETLSEIVRVAGTTKKKAPKMSAASYGELLVACEGIDPKNPEHASFLCDQMNSEATAEAAGKAWTRKLLAEATTARQAAETARQEAEAAKATRTVSGVDPLTEPVKGKAKKDDAYSGDPVADFDVAVREKVASGMPRLKAISAVSRTNPELHKAFLMATNGRKAKALIEDKFDQE